MKIVIYNDNSYVLKKNNVSFEEESDEDQKETIYVEDVVKKLIIKKHECYFIKIEKLKRRER